MPTTYIPQRTDLINKCELNFKDPILFLPISVENSTDYRSKSYVLKLHGVLTNGQKVIVNIKNIKVFFDILIENVTINEVIDTLNTQNIPFYHEIIEKYPIKGYNETKKKFLRVYTKNNQDRKDLINSVKEKYQTYSDDLTSYYRKVARENDLHLTKWNIINSYYYSNTTFYVNNILDIELYEGDISNIDEKILVMAWDIETYSNRPGALPMAQYDGDEVFMICIACAWKDSITPIAKICISTQPLLPVEDWTILYSSNQIELLTNFARCIKQINPDIITGFNDSGYDWPFIIGKLEKFGLLQQFMKIITNRECSIEQIETYNILENEIKISATDMIKAKYIKLPGILNIDTRICYKKIYPNSEKSSLKYFLELENLEGKLDLSPLELSKIYFASKEFNKSNNINEEISYYHQKRILEVAEYCMRDSISCLELLIRRKIISNYQQVSDIAYVSLLDSYLYASGIKVRNLIGAYANR